ncbi:unnamed protein product [Adineta ricciae]|uniref:Tetraspanin n=1 Tax=Adineta ricciae TaxID=249248 RepID=A0A815BWA1_ADIRI|nr:unnamed protein product [Adineta ricciae]CAF1275970.1 unnamed protein product [Adineta ricciae]
MKALNRLFGIIFTALILIFAIFHLAVGISIIVKVRHYGDVFKPERGIAAFNIVISIYGLIVGGFGLFAQLTGRAALSKVVAFGSVALAFFALVSLITSLIINSLAINYATSHFNSRMTDYKNTQSSRDIVDSIQVNYDCCGSNTWLDWSAVGLNATASTTNSTVTTQIASNSTTTVSSGTSSTTAFSTTAAITTSTTTAASGIGETTTTTSSLIISDSGTSTTTDISSGKMAEANGQALVRRKRQAQSTYGGIVGLPLSFNVTLPQSCCTNNLGSTENLANLYCISNANNVSNNMHTDGCAKKIGKFAVSQTLGLVVINSFLVVLSLAVIPLLFQKDVSPDYSQSMPINAQIAQYQQYTNDPYQYNSVHYPFDPSYNNSFQPTMTYS